MAREVNGELSSRIIILERLIDTSQKQIHRMEELLLEVQTARQQT